LQENSSSWATNAEFLRKPALLTRFNGLFYKDLSHKSRPYISENPLFLSLVFFPVCSTSLPPVYKKYVPTMKQLPTLLLSFFLSWFALAAAAQSWKAVSTGYYYSLAVQENGTLWSAGLNDYHQLGREDTLPAGHIYQIGTSKNWEVVAATYQYSAGLQKDSTLWIWGRQHPVNPDSLYNDVPAPVQVGGHDWRQMSADYFQLMAIKTDSTLWAWGENGYGAVGDGTNIDKKVPTPIGGTMKWREVSCGDQYSLAIRNNGELWAWGRNDLGQYGDNSYVSKNFPVKVGSQQDWKTISAGTVHVVAIKNDGTLWAWGVNSNHAVGDGTTTWRNYPVQISASHDWQNISAGSHYTLAVKTDGSLWGWGYNGDYQLGTGSNTEVTTPTQIGTAHDWKTGSAQLTHSLGIKEDGSLWGWGNGQSGSLGCVLSSPVPVELDCAVSAVENRVPEIRVSIYPNPTTAFIHVAGQNALNNAPYIITNALGQRVATGRIRNILETIDVRSLVPGIYVMTIKTEEGQVNRQFVKK